jgi:hypothetical protein
MLDLAGVHQNALVAWQIVRTVYTEPVLYVGTGTLLFLEWWRPARPDQRHWRVGFAQDFVWLGVQTLAHVLVLAA